jgi:hypothetical protein
LRLKWRVPKKNLKNNTSGSSKYGIVELLSMIAIRGNQRFIDICPLPIQNLHGTVKEPGKFIRDN